jgi:GSH-dependent disulfide-bond oxidoreductase
VVRFCIQELPLISLYTWFTPNGYKISILLEELGVPYDVHPINLGAKQQLTPEFLAISPNNKVPAIVDHDANDMTLFESGAILTYLAEKHGRFLDPHGTNRYRTLEWLDFHVGGVGPWMAHLVYFAGKWRNESPLATQRIVTELHRLFGVLEGRLAVSKYLAGDMYTIADIANYPWIAAAEDGFAGLLGDFLSTRPSLKRWLRLVGERPAVQRGSNVPSHG